MTNFIHISFCSSLTSNTLVWWYKLWDHRVLKKGHPYALSYHNFRTLPPLLFKVKERMKRYHSRIKTQDAVTEGKRHNYCATHTISNSHYSYKKCRKEIYAKINKFVELFEARTYFFVLLHLSLQATTSQNFDIYEYIRTE
jgi:hypothetical protein